MLVRRYTPRPPLSSFVHCFWYSEGAPQTHSRERLLPNGEFSIIFNLREEALRIYEADNLDRYQSYGTALVSGARSNCFVIDTKQQECVIGIQFRPGGAFPFFKMPASAAQDTSIDLDDLWPGRSREIRERLLNASGIRSMFTTLEHCLLEQIAHPLELHPAVAYALNQFGSASQASRVTAVSEQVGLSARRFIELFHRQVGLTPKLFCRVRRFQQVLQAVRDRREIDWAQIALDCGYYDQPHFIHDFHAFSGLTPSGYAAAATLHANHVPLV